MTDIIAPAYYKSHHNEISEDFSGLGLTLYDTKTDKNSVSYQILSTDIPMAASDFSAASLLKHLFNAYAQIKFAASTELASLRNSNEVLVIKGEDLERFHGFLKHYRAICSQTSQKLNELIGWHKHRFMYLIDVLMLARSVLLPDSHLSFKHRLNELLEITSLWSIKAPATIASYLFPDSLEAIVKSFLPKDTRINPGHIQLLNRCGFLFHSDTDPIGTHEPDLKAHWHTVNLAEMYLFNKYLIAFLPTEKPGLVRFYPPKEMALCLQDKCVSLFAEEKLTFKPILPDLANIFSLYLPERMVFTSSFEAVLSELSLTERAPHQNNPFIRPIFENGLQVYKSIPEEYRLLYRQIYGSVPDALNSAPTYINVVNFLELFKQTPVQACKDIFTEMAEGERKAEINLKPSCNDVKAQMLMTYLFLAQSHWKLSRPATPISESILPKVSDKLDDLDLNKCIFQTTRAYNNNHDFYEKCLCHLFLYLTTENKKYLQNALLVHTSVQGHLRGKLELTRTDLNRILVIKLKTSAKLNLRSLLEKFRANYTPKTTPAIDKKRQRTPGSASSRPLIKQKTGSVAVFSQPLEAQKSEPDSAARAQR